MNEGIPITIELSKEKRIKMDIKDFTEHEQKQINAGLTTSVITDKEAAKKILELVPSEWIKKIPFLVRAHATTRTVARVAKQYPEL